MTIEGGGEEMSGVLDLSDIEPREAQDELLQRIKGLLINAGSRSGKLRWAEMAAIDYITCGMAIFAEEEE